MNKRIAGLLVILMLLVSAFYGVQASVAKDKGHERTILEFDTMVGVPAAYTGATNPIRGINGGGIPWVIRSGSGELKQSGELKVEVRGLVLATTGANPIASFKAIVSCQSVDAAGMANVVNVSSDLFPATTGAAAAGGGNAEIEADLSLPQPCIAPIVFVTSPGGAWFAATGF